MSNSKEMRKMAGELIIKLFAKKVENYFKPMIIDKVVENRGAILVKYFVESYIKIDNKEYLMHYRLSSLDEVVKREEIVEEGKITFSDYFDLYVKGQRIKRVKCIFVDRLDEAYLVFWLENGYTVEIPLGFSAEDALIYGHLEELLTNEEINCYYILRNVVRAITRNKTNREVPFEKKSVIYREILQALEIEKGFEYELSDFYKINKIKKIVEGEIKNAAETIAAIERVVYS